MAAPASTPLNPRNSARDMFDMNGSFVRDVQNAPSALGLASGTS